LGCSLSLFSAHTCSLVPLFTSVNESCIWCTVGLFPMRRYTMAMARRGEFVSYRPKTLLNKRRRPAHRFWTRYSAHPCKGCQHRCLFCQCWEVKHCAFDDPSGSGYSIQASATLPGWRRGLESIENVGPKMAEVIEEVLLGLLTRPAEVEGR